MRIVGGDKDDEGRVLPEAKLACGLEPIELRHAYIEKCHVGREFVGEFQRFGAVRGEA